MSKGGRIFLFLLLLLFGWLPSAKAQSTFGDVIGVVKDPGQRAVAGAQVALTSAEEGDQHTAVTDADGAFHFVNLKPGHYNIVVSAAGFADFKISATPLAARQTLRLDVELKLASTSQTVEVAADSGPTINTENGTITGTLANQQITQLALNSRAVSTSPLSALALSPDVQQDGQGNISVGGATASMVGYSVDGISTANVRQNGALQDAYPSSEGIAELKVTAFNNNAEFAQIGDVTFTTKSGTSALHGSLFEYLQNDALDARVLNFTEKAPKRYNTFGGSLSGPVSVPKLYDGKDKTFFFFDYEGNRRRTSTAEQYLVPTLAQRNGDLNGLPIANSTGTLMNPATGQPFQSNTIPSTQINQTAKTLLNEYYPLPNANLNSPGASFNYETLVPTPSNTNGLDLRIDQNITAKQQVYARVSWKNVLTDVANPLLPNDADTEHNRSVLVSYNYAMNSKWVNEFRVGFTNVLVDVGFPILGSAAISELRLQGIDISEHPDGDAFPTFNFSDGTGFTSIGRDRAGTTHSRTLEFTDNVTHNAGKRTVRFGVDVRKVNYQDLMYFDPSDDYGLFTFNKGVFTGSSFGDFLLGLPNTTFFAITSPQVNASTTQYGVYGQDEWQVTDRLTVNFGMRWELLPPFTEAIGDLGSFDPRKNSVLVPNQLQATLARIPSYQSVYTTFLQSFNACSLGYTALPCTNVLTASQDNVTQGLRQLYLRDFDPRVSIAFRPFGNNKTVIRAGFGIFTMTTLGPLSYNNAGNPLSALHTYTNDNGGHPLFQFPQTSTATQVIQYGGGSLDQANTPLFRDPQSAQWNLTVERELATNTSLRVSYAGMNSYRLTVTEDLNQIAPSTTPYVPSPYVDPRAPYQNWFTLLSTENAASANYQSLQVQATHQMRNGLFFQANYALTKNLSDAQGDAPSGFASEVAYGLAVSNRFDLAADRGNVEGTPRNRFQLNGVYQLPFGSTRKWMNKSRWLDAVAGGWDVNTVTLLQSGPWLTPTISATADQTNTDILNRGTILRPDCVGNPAGIDGIYFNPAAFAATPAGAGRYGSCGVGILEGPGTVAVAAGLSKTFLVREKLKLRFESTFTNILNHTNFAPPATNISNTQTFGVLQSAQTAANAGNRTGQVALRLDF
jgi:hypothetical protein